MAGDGRGAMLAGQVPGYAYPQALYQLAEAARPQPSSQGQPVQVPVQLQASAPLAPQTSSPSTQGRVLQVQPTPLPTQSSPLQVQGANVLHQASSVTSLSSNVPSQGSSLLIQSSPLPSQASSLQVQSAPLPSQSALLPSQSGALPVQGSLQPSQSGPLQSQSSALLSQCSSAVSSQTGLSRPASLVMTGMSTVVQATPPVEVLTSIPPESFSLPSPSAGSDHDGDDLNLDWVVWSPDDVADWVDGLLGPGSGVPFRRDDVDGPMLVRLTDEQLRDSMGVRDPVQRAKLLGHLRAFKARRDRLAKRAARRKAGAGRQPQGSHPATPTSQKAPGQSEGCLRSAGSSVSAGLSVGSTSVSRRPGSGGSSVVGQTSFGQDTPSTSLRGSFATASRQPAAPFADTPGPCSYNVLEAEGSSAKTCSPIKATIGKSPRRTSEYFAQDTDAPGPSCYHVGSAGLRSAVSPRPTIGNSVRKTSQVSETNIGPGPCSYNVDSNSLRSSSPRPTIGTSRRNTTEFMVSRDAAEAGMKGRLCRSSGRLPSPRARNGHA